MASVKLLFVCINDPFEAEAFFDEDGSVVVAWSNNDATWRQEYMGGLLTHLGATVEISEDPELVSRLRRYWGDE